MRYWDTELRSYVLHGYGFRAVCRCGYKGSVHKLRATAMADLHWHREDGHH